MSSVTHNYQSYLLRLWKNGLEGGPGWRASLESPNTGMRQGFISLQELFAYLAQECNGEVMLEVSEGPTSRVEGDRSGGHPPH